MARWPGSVHDARILRNCLVFCLWWKRVSPGWTPPWQVDIWLDLGSWHLYNVQQLGHKGNTTLPTVLHIQLFQTWATFRWASFHLPDLIPHLVGHKSFFFSSFLFFCRMRRCTRLNGANGLLLMGWSSDFEKHFQKLFSLHRCYSKNGLNLDKQSLHEEYEFWNFFLKCWGRKKALFNKH